MECCTGVVNVVAAKYERVYKVWGVYRVRLCVPQGGRLPILGGLIFSSLARFGDLDQASLSSVQPKKTVSALAPVRSFSCLTYRI